MDTQRKALPAYDDDFHAWLIAQAAAVRERRWDDVDVEHLIEEIDGLAGSDRREVVSRLAVLIMHMLKQDLQPERDSRSWQSTIRTQAFHLNQVLDDSPSLRARLDYFVAQSFPQARADASVETGIPIDRFPWAITDDLAKRLTEVLAASKRR